MAIYSVKRVGDLTDHFTTLIIYFMRHAIPNIQIFTISVTSLCFVAIAIGIFTLESARNYMSSLESIENSMSYSVKYGPIAPQLPQDVIKAMAMEYEVNTDLALRIAHCESNFDPLAKNPHSSASGLYQFTDGTWEYIGAPGDRFNTEDNARAFMIWYPKHPNWWVCK